MELVKEYLEKISVVETCEWDGFINRDIVLLMNEIILRWQKAEIKNANALRTDQVEKIYEQGYNEISKIIENMNKKKHNKITYRNTISEIIDLFDKFKSIGLDSGCSIFTDHDDNEDDHSDSWEDCSDYSDDHFKKSSPKLRKLKIVENSVLENCTLDTTNEENNLEKSEDLENSTLSV